MTQRADQGRRGEGEPAAPKVPDWFDAPPGGCDLEPEADYESLDLREVRYEGRRGGAAVEAVSFTRCRFHGVDLSGARLPASRFTDCLIDTCDWSNLRVEHGNLTRVRFAGSRMTGLSWADGVARDVVLDECRLDLTGWRFTRFRAVRFVRCRLTGADFTGADLTGASFLGCDLTGAHFDGARMAGARFGDCVLAGVGGVTSWRGAVVKESDLVGLSYVLAAALGIKIQRDDR